MTGRRVFDAIHPDPCPELEDQVDKSDDGNGVGWWVPEEKHRRLGDYIEASHGARRRWKHRVYIDLYSGPGRIQVKGEAFTRDGGAVLAWRQSQRVPASSFTQIIVGDLNPARLQACAARLKALDAPVEAVNGAAGDTAAVARSLVPSRDSLVLVYLDPYNLAALDFRAIDALASLPRVDFIVHFSTMDFARNLRAEIERGRFDTALPGWQACIKGVSGDAALREAAFGHWRMLIERKGFKLSGNAPLVRRAEGTAPMYRLIFFSRTHSPLAEKLWSDVSQGQQGNLDF